MPLESEKVTAKMRDTTVCILAGGSGRRMGGQKCLQFLMGKRLIDHAISVAEEVKRRGQCSALVVSCGDNELSLNGTETLKDVDGQGPMAGLYSCLLAYGRTLIFPCDMPFLTADFLLFLLERAAGHDITVCRLAGFVQPQVGIYSAGCLSRVKELIRAGTYSLFKLTRDGKLNVRIVDEEEFFHIGDPDKIFLNINTSEELEKARQNA